MLLSTTLTTLLNSMKLCCDIVEYKSPLLFEKNIKDIRYTPVSFWCDSLRPPYTTRATSRAASRAPGSYEPAWLGSGFLPLHTLHEPSISLQVFSLEITCNSPIQTASQAKYLEVTDQREPSHEPDCAARGSARDAHTLHELARGSACLLRLGSWRV